MIRNIRMRRAYHANIIDRVRRVFEQLAYFDPTLPILLKLKRGGERRAGFPLGLRIVEWQHFSRVLLESRFRIERVYVGWTAVHEKVNDTLRRAGKLSAPRREGVHVRTRALCRRSERILQQRAE